MKQIAELFGTSLDQDDFETTKTTLSDNCQYDIGSEVLVGATAICNSYEQNMIEGHKKMDKLEWGKSWIEDLGNNEYFVHFTDYLTHKGETYTHRCKQQLTIENDKIIKIKHIQNETESKKLRAFYDRVGIP